ncbi:FAD-binding Berberine family protein [Hibiscus syriacus]|uniref:FAD-binding Berberine family protein n=1 Tax=Hibiscus syriacus TaxID=106335 RepID=A0A6A3BZ92_HIBSY|nr:berberine bridge enzyme-like 8 [Hibiscus syriacus]KAE8722065.1 FAD-binding Berberine family protein [Hibiscus syriacus]
MKSCLCSMLTPLVLAALFSFSFAALPHQDFLRCLSLRSDDYSSISKVVFTPTNPSYESVLDASIWNLRFNSTDTPKPLVIVTPTKISHVQATIYCSRKHGLQTRTRSGGHDYEGLSFVAKVPFVIVDLVNFRAVEVDVENRVAWVQSGAILGELYYRIAEKSRALAFPGGIFHTIGVGGHISGGGFGLLFRKYGTAADNVIDAQFIDVEGRILDRKSMGEDLFWAIRGGGGGSFGIVLAWKLCLVPVPATLTEFTVSRTLEQNATELVHRWQSIAHDLPDGMYPNVALRSIKSTQDGTKTVVAIFSSLFLGTIDELLPIMHNQFPELELSRQNCREMSWIESILYETGIQNQPLEILLNRTFRTPLDNPFYKIKSDYVKEPISEAGLKGLFSRLTEEAAASTSIVFFAYGGIMDRIPEDATPFPHRTGNLYKIFYNVGWQEENKVNSQIYLDWARRTYDYMTPFVSKSPREAYINYRDLDIGSNNIGYTSYAQASIWGHKYFKDNFDRLVHVKTTIDPDNFFKHEQSIPTLY